MAAAVSLQNHASLTTDQFLASIYARWIWKQPWHSGRHGEYDSHVLSTHFICCNLTYFMSAILSIEEGFGSLNGSRRKSRVLWKLYCFCSNITTEPQLDLLVSFISLLSEEIDSSQFCCFCAAAPVGWGQWLTKKPPVNSTLDALLKPKQKNLRGVNISITI